MKNGLKVLKVTSNQKIGIPTNQRKRNMKNCPITVMFSSKTDSTNTWTSEIKHYSL
jgi:hypothetical protein